MQKNALIVDDNRALAEDLAEILEGEGYRVAVYDDPQRVLEQEADLRFDVALLDVRMPGMDGVTLQRLLMRSHPSARFVLMTAYADDTRISQGLSAGAAAVLTKPVPLKELFAALGDSGSRALLLVEDDARFREVLSEALSQSGYTCRSAASAEEARKLLDQLGDSGDLQPELGVIDVRLPDQDGAQFALELTQRKGLRCVLITGWNIDPDSPIRRELTVITKPFSPDVLLRVLSQLRGEGT